MSFDIPTKELDGSKAYCHQGCSFVDSKGMICNHVLLYGKICQLEIERAGLDG